MNINIEVIKKDLYNFEHRWKLRDWIDEEIKKQKIIFGKNKLDCKNLSKNPNALCFLENNLEFIDSETIQSNPNAMYLFKNEYKKKTKSLLNCTCDIKKINKIKCSVHYQNTDELEFIDKLNLEPIKIDWSELSKNPNAIHFLKNNLDKIDWNSLSLNENPEAIELLENDPNKINWINFCLNKSPKVIKLLEENPDEIDWNFLSSNSAAIDLIEKYFHTCRAFHENNPTYNFYDICRINWFSLSKNSAAIHFFEQNPDKIKWRCFSSNPSAIHLLEEKINRNDNYGINWNHLSLNPTAIHLLEKFRNKICWTSLSMNPSIFELDYQFFFDRMNIIRQELIEKTWHPERFRDWCLDIDEVKVIKELN